MTTTPSDTDWAGLAGRLDAALHPTAAPIAITFSAEPPAGVSPFDTPMAAPAADGREARYRGAAKFWPIRREPTTLPPLRTSEPLAWSGMAAWAMPVMASG